MFKHPKIPALLCAMSRCKQPSNHTLVLTYIDDFNAFVVFEKLQRDRHILEFLVAEIRLFVVLQEPLAGQDLDESDETKSVGEVVLEVRQVLVDGLQVFVRPAREAVLLDQLPLSVAGQFSLGRRTVEQLHGTSSCGRHVCDEDDV